jgi:hypothetical protein
MLFSLVIAFAAVNLALAFRHCAGNNYQFPFIGACAHTYPPLAVATFLVNLIHPIGFNATLIGSAVLPIAEIIFSLIPDISSGQSQEQQFTRPLYASFVAIVFLPIHYSTEKQNRERFLLAKRLQQLTFAARCRKEQIAASLASFCDEDHLKLLLNGTVVSDIAPVASVMITAIDNFPAWRQGWLPKHALAMVDLLFESLESSRQMLGVEKISFRGDKLISAIGLRVSSTEHGLVRNTFGDPSRLLGFAVRQRFAASGIETKLRSSGPLLPKLRWGFGRDSCRGFLVPGSVVHYLIRGAAFDQASAELEKSTPGVIEVPAALLGYCHEFNIETAASARGEGTVICLDARFRAQNPEAASLQTNLLVDAGLHANRVIAPSSSDATQQRHSNSDDPMGVWSMKSFPGNSNNSLLHAPSTPKVGQPSVLDNDDYQDASFVDLFRLEQPEGYAEFQEHRAKKVQPVSLAVWFTTLALYLTVFVLEGNIDVVYGVLLVVGFGLLVIPLLPLPSAPRSWLMFIVSVVELLILSSFSLIRQDSLLTSFVTYSLNILLMIFCALARHAPAAVVSSFALIYYLVLVVLTLTHPDRFTGEPGRVAVRLVVGLFFDAAIVVSRIQSDRRVFDNLLRRKALQEREVAEKQVHEQVLRMILPDYIVPLIAQRQALGSGGMLIDALPDVSLLLLKFNPASHLGSVPAPDLARSPTARSAPAGWESMLKVSQLMDSFIQGAESMLYLIRADGDTFCYGGPLHRNLNEFEELPATSNFAGRAVKRFALEKAADAAGVELLRLLRLALDNCESCTAVLHRSDALASVSGVRRPSFALFGPVTETADAILEATKSMSVDGHAFLGPAKRQQVIATASFVESRSRFPEAWTSAGLTVGPSLPLAAKPLGLQRLFYLGIESAGNPTQ